MPPGIIHAASPCRCVYSPPSGLTEKSFNSINSVCNVLRSSSGFRLRTGLCIQSSRQTCGGYSTSGKSKFSTMPKRGASVGRGACQNRREFSSWLKFLLRKTSNTTTCTRLPALYLHSRPNNLLLRRPPPSPPPLDRPNDASRLALCAQLFDAL